MHYFRNEKNSRQEVSRMNGFRMARGECITFLDDDDYYTDSEFFAKAINIFREHEADEVPIVMVYANAKMLNVQTGESSVPDLGVPGRVSGIDFILHRRGYTKPPSIFTAVFRADTLRRAGLEDKIIFDTMTYIEAALEGDGWLMPDVIGVYSISPNNMTNGKARSPEGEARHYVILTENIRRWKHAAEVLRSRTDEDTAKRCYVSNIVSLIEYYAIARPSIKDRLKTGMCAVKVSEFMPSLWCMMVLANIRWLMKQVIPLRELYRFIKYRLRIKSYPEH